MHTQTTPEQWLSQGHYSQHRGHQLFYRHEGQGEALVCIHGYPTASWDWVKLWPQLTQHFEVVAPDMIGFGFSAKPYRYAYSILDQATLHENLLKQLGITQVHILAHDYGDTVAQELLARYEDRRRYGSQATGLSIKSICFLNGGLFPETHHAKPIQHLLQSPVGFLLVRLYGEAKFRKTFQGIFGKNTPPSEEEYQHFWALITREGGKNILHKLIGYMRERKRYRERWVGALVNTQIPLRVIDGAADPVSGAHMVARYKALVPNPDTILLPEIGHYPQVEAPEAVWEAFWAFVAPHLQG